MSFFSTDGRLYAAWSLLTDLVLLNLVFVCASLPLFTLGASATALYSVAFRLAEGKGVSVLRNFFGAFRANFRQGTAVWALSTAVLAVLAVDFRITTGLMEHSALPAVGVCALLLLYAAVMSCVYPLNAKFESGVRRLFGNAWRLAAAFPPRTLLGLALTAAPWLLLALLAPLPALAGFVLLLFGFSAPALFQARNMLAVFRRAGMLPPEAEDGHFD